MTTHRPDNVMSFHADSWMHVCIVQRETWWRNAREPKANDGNVMRRDDLTWNDECDVLQAEDRSEAW
ncbi:hypothetical protein [Pandoraea horticolens]|uniref:hypothetical protein n=1 Tax=Pandoraea horticolens TaxID=2508298 RepID=UPI001242134B|nr:hypothetical protein [Pandoraea horticolens]